MIDSRVSEGHSDTLVIISYYDARPIDNLKCLVSQLLRDPSDGYDICVVVNATKPDTDAFLIKHAGFTVIRRENIGFNIGAWDHGWKAIPGYEYYIFLQDECIVRRDDWLASYKAIFKKYNNKLLMGESKMYWDSWSALRKKYAPIAVECRRLAAVYGVAPGRTPTHIQSLVFAAPAETLNKLGGFFFAEDKVEAMATEILISRHAVSKGIPIVQSAWRPFTYFGHEQWNEIRGKSGKISWSLKRVFHRLITGE